MNGAKQPGFCCICGKADRYAFSSNRPVLCDGDECREEYWWRNTLYIRNKPYYPRLEEPCT